MDNKAVQLKDVQVLLIGTPEEAAACLPRWLRIPGIRLGMAAPEEKDVESAVRIPGISRFESIEVACRTLRVDLAHVCGERGFAYAAARRAVEFGVDLVLPAPLPHALRAPESFARFARKHAAQVSVLHSWRFAPGIARMVEFFESRVAGGVREVELRIPCAALTAFCPTLSFAGEAERKKFARFMGADLALWFLGPELTLAAGGPKDAGTVCVCEGGERRARIRWAEADVFELTVTAENGYAHLRADVPALSGAGESTQVLELGTGGASRVLHPPAADPVHVALAYAVFLRRRGLPDYYLPLAESARVRELLEG